MTPLCKVGAESIPLIREIAERTWGAAHSPVISPEQMRYMLDLFYSEASLQKQMQEGHQFIIAKEKNKAIGFASYSIKPEDDYEDPGLLPHPGKDMGKSVEVMTNVYRLHKINVDPDQQGKGIGKLLIGFVINDISSYDATQLKLNVNRHNKAVDFYQKIGFEIVKEEYVNIGNGYYTNDYIMSLALQTYV
jgi:ribosomal protein S18 acetylase RimI-like enzyme